MQLVTMKCPKCGHSQEQRQDCVRCGIVFAKYYAMYPLERDMPAEGQESMVFSQTMPGDALSIEISELRQSVREIASRLSDVEFERAERSLLRGEVKSVEQKVAELAEDLQNRLLALENHAVDTDAEGAPQQLSGTALDDVAERFGQIEKRLEGIADQIRLEAPGTADMIREIATRQSGLEDRVDNLITGLQKGGEAGRPAEKELEELRLAVQSATLRYSEIGDLKKNHLVLQNEIEALRRDQETLRNQPANDAAARIVQLESEVAALRAELRQTLTRLESMEADFVVQLREARVSAHADSDGAELTSSLAQLNADLKEGKTAWAQQNELFSSELRRFEDWNRSMATGLQETSDEVKGLCGRIDGLTSDVRILKQESMQLRAQLQALQDRAQEPGSLRAANQPSPVEGDLRAIKDGLDQIRVFMQTLEQRL